MADAGRLGLTRGVYKKEFFAETREQAVSSAAAHFEVEAGKLDVYEVPMSADIVGTGGRRCFVASVAGMADALPPEGDRPRGRERRDDRDGRGRRREGGGDRRGGDRSRRGDRDRPRSDRSRSDGPRRDRPRGDKPEGVDHERFEAMARDAADRVRSSGKPEIMEPMNSKERWVVHNYLKDVAGVTSISEGEGSEKRIKVIPDDDRSAR